MKGHQPLDAEVKYKYGDEGRFVFHGRDDRSHQPRRLQRAASTHADGLRTCRGARGMGEPVRLMVVPAERANIAELMSGVREC